LKRLARKPSTASLTPATMKIAKAISISPDAIAQTLIGTRRIRVSVIMFGLEFGMSHGASRLPA
jgi:hypothetical protein